MLELGHSVFSPLAQLLLNSFHLCNRRLSGQTRSFTDAVTRNSIRQNAIDALCPSPAECEHWILQVCNRWQENLDVYEHGQGYITKFTANFEADGSILAVMADRDPGLGGNWIDTFEHEAGVFSLRLIQTEGAPSVSIQEVALAELESRGLAALEDVTPILSGGPSET